MPTIWLALPAAARCATAHASCPSLLLSCASAASSPPTHPHTCTTILQELRQERERTAALQAQLEAQARTAQDSSSRSSTLADDNQKLKDAIERLNRTYQDQTNQAVQHMQEAGELRKKNLELEQAAQSAQDAQKAAERKLQSVEKVRRRIAAVPGLAESKGFRRPGRLLHCSIAARLACAATAACLVWCQGWCLASVRIGPAEAPGSTPTT